MPIYSIPDSPAHAIARFEWGLRQSVLVNTSKFSGSVERLELPGSRWVATLGHDNELAYEDIAAEREAFWMKVGGPANLVRLWHRIRPIPRGSMRGSPTLASALAQGATSMSIQTTPGATLKHADMLKVGSMLFMCHSPATADGSGVMSVSVTPPARVSAPSGATVEWDKPTGTFMPTGEIRVPYGDGGAQMPFTIELVEVW
jgi:hypothetical protein